MAQGYGMIEIGSAKVFTFWPENKILVKFEHLHLSCEAWQCSHFWHDSSLPTGHQLCQFGKKTLLSKKSYFTSKYAPEAKLQKTRILVVKKWPRQTLLSTKIFWGVERGFLKVLTHQNSTLFQNCKGMRFSHLSPYHFLLNLQKKWKNFFSSYNLNKNLTCCSKNLGSIDY